jgi:outer membrane protein OmpA-like peptidoglycan-associated protein
MSKIEISGVLVSLVALSAVAAGCGGASAGASADVGVSANGGVSANAGVSADVGVDANASVGVGANASFTATTTVGTQYANAGTPGCVEEWVHMPVIINFPTSGTQMDAQNRAILDELWRSAQSRTDLRGVRIEGHTDRCGSEANNMVLSQQRAEMVAGELVTLGVPRERIMTIGYGSQMLRANDDCTPNHELSRATNRRVEFSLLICRGG